MSKTVSEENSKSRKVQTLHGGVEGGDSSVPLDSKRSRLSAKLLLVFWLSVLGLAALLLIFGERYHGNVFGPKAMMQKSDTLAALRVSLLKSVESEQRAVMADTDEASRAFAEESRKASEVVNAERDQLAELINQYPAEDEKKFLSEFNETWEQLRKLDQQILELAVQNTNLKAAALSFGQASETLHRFQAAMQKLAMDATTSKLFA